MIISVVLVNYTLYYLLYLHKGAKNELIKGKLEKHSLLYLKGHLRWSKNAQKCKKKDPF